MFHRTRSEVLESFRRKVAAHWGITYAQLEALALGEEPPASTAKPVVRSEMPPNLESTLADYRWMPELPRDLRTVVRDQARLYYRSRGHDFPREEWRRVLTGLEREALGFAARHPSDQPTTRTGRHRRRAER